MKLLGCLLLVASVLTAEPKVTYLADTATTAAGVTALTPADPSFEAAFGDLVRNTPALAALARVRPYLLIVQNHSPRSIVTIGVRREISYPDRAPVVWIYTIERGDGTPVLLSGKTLVAFQGPDASMIDHLATELAAATEVVVSLDIVIFDSGLVVGPDKDGATARLAVEKQAIEDLLKQIQAAPQGFHALKQHLAAAHRPARNLPLVDWQRDTAYVYQTKQRELALFFQRANFDVEAAAKYLQAVNRRLKPLYRQ